jgi:hypothetical protein
LNGENPNILIRVADAEGDEDYSDNIICPKVRGALTIKVTSLAEDVIEIGSENNSMLKLELIANGGKVKVNSLQLNIEGSATDTDVPAVELYESAGGTNSPRPPSFTSRSRKIAEGDFSEGEREDKQIRFIFDPAIVIKQEEPKTYFVTIDISDSAKMSRTVGLSLGSDDVQTNCPVTIIWESGIGIRASRLSYVGSAPDAIVIDGAFADWESIGVHKDLDTINIKNSNVDIDEYMVVNSDDKISFYFSVKGSMLGGSVVPIRPKFSIIPPQMVREKIEKPLEPLEVRPRPVYEALKAPTAELGEDRVYIFLDTDFDSTTGYSPDRFQIGAEHMLEIWGGMER